MKTEALERITHLRSEITRHNRLYYQAAAPEITDHEYDVLVAELEILERANPEFMDSMSPTQLVGSDLTGGFPLVEHVEPMMSIANTYSPGELRDFNKRAARDIVEAGGGDWVIDYVCEPKVDGVALTLLYDGGILRYAATRGNGKRGEDVTANALTSKDIPRRISYKGKIEIRGELFISAGAFRDINAERQKAGEALFANPRNACAGTVKSLDPAKVAKRPLSFFAHGFGVISKDVDEVMDGASHSWWAMRAFFEEIGFRPIPRGALCIGIEEVLEYIDACREFKDSLGFATDGVVVKVDSYAKRAMIGYTSKSPKWASAFKFASEQGETKLLAVDWQVGRTGILTPVARMEPTPLCGTVVSNATLHNMSEIKRLGIKVGDTIIIEKGGEIIPKVVGIREDLRDGEESEIQFPDKCPSCGGQLRPDDSASLSVRCINPRCIEALVQGIRHFCGRNAMDIEGIGEKLARQLVISDKASLPHELYMLDRETLASLDRMGEKSADGILAQIAKSRDITLDRFIFALGIRHVGLSTAQDVAVAMRTLENVQAASIDDFLAIQGVGAIVATSLYEYFRSRLGHIVVCGLIDFGVIPKPVDTSKMQKEQGVFSGRKFVFTGTISMERHKAEAEVKRRGGSVTGSVSKKTDVVVVGDAPGSKYDKAKELGIETWDDTKFIQMVTENPA
jgi:DNA ligase (NAD+)